MGLINEAQIKENLRRALQAKKLTVTDTTINLLYTKYVQSPPGTTYIQVINANASFLTKACGGCR